jgi:S-adenosylmethionine decarboxylase proenzyme
VEYMGCSFDALNNVEQIQALMEMAAVAAKTNIVFSKFKPFEPQGVSGVVVVEESHLSIHTWPEHGYAAVDFYTCGEGDPNEAHEVLKAGLEAQSFEMLYVERGKGLAGGPCMSLQSHTRDSLLPPPEVDLGWPGRDSADA